MEIGIERYALQAVNQPSREGEESIDDHCAICESFEDSGIGNAEVEK